MMAEYIPMAADEPDLPEPFAVQADLEQRLRRRIAQDSPITFAQFMDAALYDPEEGFYTRPPIGERGDFVTSPHVSGLFGVLVARQIEEFWDMLGRPERFDVVEVGAGDGTLARQILDALPAVLLEHTSYIAVERSPGARRALAEAGIRAVSSVADSIGDLANGLTGCVIANEVLDNLPFHLVRHTAAGLAQVLVSVDRRGGFVLVEGDAPPDDVAALVPSSLRPGHQAAVSPAALELVDQAINVIERGYVFLVDYGVASGQAPPPVHSYRGHRVEADVLTAPGSRDITAGVDFDRLVAHARSRTPHVWGPVRQRDALLRLGFRELHEHAQTRQVEAIGARRGIDAMRIYSNRNRANQLLARPGLGEFFVVCFGVGTPSDPAPSSVRETGEGELSRRN